MSREMVIVCGPQGCGKTRQAEALRAHFGMSRVQDDWRLGDGLQPGTLYLTQESFAPAHEWPEFPGLRVVDFHDLVKAGVVCAPALAA